MATRLDSEADLAAPYQPGNGDLGAGAPCNADACPWDEASQHLVLELALHVLEAVPAMRATLQKSMPWPGRAHWGDDLSDVSRLSAADSMRKRAANDRVKAAAQEVRDATLGAAVAYASARDRA